MKYRTNDAPDTEKVTMTFNLGQHTNAGQAHQWQFGGRLDVAKSLDAELV